MVRLRIFAETKAQALKRARRETKKRKGDFQGMVATKVTVKSKKGFEGLKRFSVRLRKRR